MSKPVAFPGPNHPARRRQPASLGRMSGEAVTAPAAIYEYLGESGTNFMSLRVILIKRAWWWMQLVNPQSCLMGYAAV
jgi:hypothetical protein